ncbi:hypothetical protein ACT3UQ_16670 [Glutamicibacter sp. AOP12-B1-11]|uniref:hypothetical protein n=2 Tax=Micrococcaceae TaxID=1268 RepID=UPI0011B0C787|nr:MULTISPECIES: hypothetical protein [unclassified Arthrobacter]
MNKIKDDFLPMKKPGYDTLIYFWLSIALSFLGFFLLFFGAQLAFRDGDPNPLALSPFELASTGCFALAFIFGLVVIHKIIAMLMFLVHKKQ